MDRSISYQGVLRGIRQPAGRCGGGRGRDELARIRAWAVEAGYEVAERGRIAKNILEV